MSLSGADLCPNRRSALIAGALVGLAGCGDANSPIQPNAEPIALSVRRLLASRQINADFLRAKLAVDELVQPGSSRGVAAKVERLRRAAARLAGPDADDIRKLAAVRTVIYRPGPWNDHRPFGYNLADLLGGGLPYTLLKTYFDTRLGNCVVMPILFLILAERLGVSVCLSRAPHHVFLKHLRADGSVMNLEATREAKPAPNAHYQHWVGVTDRAIQTGAYLATTDRAGTVAIMASPILAMLARAERWHDIAEVGLALLEREPNNVEAMLAVASAHGKLIDVEFKSRWARPMDIPPHLRGRLRYLAWSNQQGFARAETLGWREIDPVAVATAGRVAASIK